MRSMWLRWLAVAVGSAGALGAWGAWAAAPHDYLTADQVEAARQDIETRHQTARSQCASMVGHLKDICVVEAQTHAKMALAELNAYATTSARSRWVAAKAKAEADYADAGKQCLRYRGSTKTLCQQDARVAYVQAVADAQIEEARTTPGTDRDSQQARLAEVRKDAAQRVRNAQRQAAKMRCEAQQGQAQQRCLREWQKTWG